MKKVNVTLRFRSNTTETSRIFLDITGDGKRRKDYLGLFIYKRPKGTAQKEHNREQLHKAEMCRIELLNKLQNSQLGLEILNRKRIKFIDYFKDRLEKNKTSKGTQGNGTVLLNTWQNLIRWMFGLIR